MVRLRAGDSDLREATADDLQALKTPGPVLPATAQRRYDDRRLSHFRKVPDAHLGI